MLLFFTPNDKNRYIAFFLHRLVVNSAVFSTLFITLFSSINSHALAEVHPNNTGSGELLFKSDNGYHLATHLQSHAEVNIHGMVAKLQLTQTFRNDSDTWQQAIYSFPLNESSAVNHMEIQVGDRKIIASVKEKQQAKKIYQQALSSGKKAALTEQIRANLFTQHIANIAPKEEVSIVLKITQPIEYRDARFHWRLPMTLTPRFTPHTPSMPAYLSHPQVNLQQHEQPTIPARNLNLLNNDFFINPPFIGNGLPNNMINPIQLDIHLDAGIPLKKIDATYHQINVNKQQHSYHIATTTPQIAMDRDFELIWEPVINQAPEAAIFTENIAGDDYALLMLMPYHITTPKQRLERDITFIIDTSGSMDGTSILQAKQSLAYAIQQLSTNDHFNIIAFNSDYTALFPNSVAANANHSKQALAFVDNLTAGGGTNMAAPLKHALSVSSSMQRLKQVVFITDGSVSNESDLFKILHQQLNNTRLFTVGIGSAPNGLFMRKAAEIGKGTHTYIADTAEVQQKMQRLFHKLSSAVLTNIKLDLSQGLDAEIWPRAIPDLYAGEPLLLSMKLGSNHTQPSNQPLTLSISGETAEQHWSQDLDLSSLVHSKPISAEKKGIATLWARAKIAALQDMLYQGVPKEQVRAEVLPIALEHQLLSAYTSFIAVEQTPIDPRPSNSPINTQHVANQVPLGQTLPYPQTASPATIMALIGFLLVLGLLLVRPFVFVISYCILAIKGHCHA